MTIDKGDDATASRGDQHAAASSEVALAARAGSDANGSPIEFRLDPGSGVPTYRQLVQQVENALRLGYLKPGDRLPTVKGTVSALAINPNTVLKAYRELEQKGLAAGRPGQGTFVQSDLGQVPLHELAELRRTLLHWLSTADTAGLDEDGIVALFTSALGDFRAQPTDLRSGRRGRGTDQRGRGPSAAGTAGVA
jgi:GntR family transcriptional regulator